MNRFILVTGDENVSTGSSITASLFRLFDKTTNYTVRLIQVKLEETKINENIEEVYILKDGFATNASFGIYERLTENDFTEDSYICIEEMRNATQCRCDAFCAVLARRLQKKHEYQKTCAKLDGVITILDVKGSMGTENMELLNRAMQNILDCDNINQAVTISTEDNQDGSIKIIISKNRNSHLADEEKVEEVVEIEKAISIYQMPSLIESKVITLVSELLDVHRTRKYCDDMKFLYTDYRLCVPVTLITTSETPFTAHRSLIDAIMVAGAQFHTKIEFKFINPKKLEEKDAIEWYKLVVSKCLLLPGGYGNEGFQGKLSVIKFARKNKVPFLGICLGFQLSIIEYFRNVLDVKDATSEEFEKDSPSQVIKLLKTMTNENSGPRHGDKITYAIKSEKVPTDLVFDNYLVERFRHSYGLPARTADLIKNSDIRIIRKTANKQYCVGMEYEDHPFFVGLQCHPEFSSRFSNDATVFNAFIFYAMCKLGYSHDI